MAIFVDNNGSIRIYRGDTGNIKIIGLPKGKEYTVNFAIVNPDDGQIILEKKLESQGAEYVIFTFVPEEIELMMVDVGAKYKIYNYGVKLSDASGLEDTLIPRVSYDGSGNPVFSKPAKIYCYPKYVEGPIGGVTEDTENV